MALFECWVCDEGGGPDSRSMVGADGGMVLASGPGIPPGGCTEPRAEEGCSGYMGFPGYVMSVGLPGLE